MKNITNARNSSKKEKLPAIDPDLYPLEIAGYEASKLERYILAGRMYSKGHTYKQISEKLECSLATAHKYVKRAREFFREQAGMSYQEKVAEVYKDLDALMYEAWDAWERSKGERVKVKERIREKPAENSDGKVRKNAVGNERIITTETEVGNASFLLIVARCVDRKAAILGLEKEAENQKGLAQFLAQSFDRISHERYLRPTEEDLSAN